jgi:hypothetical protein
MKIVFSDKIKKDILFTLTKVLPSVFIVYLIGMFIENDYKLIIIEFISLFVFGCIGLFCVAAALLFVGLCIGSISACKGRYLFGIINISKNFFCIYC